MTNPVQDNKALKIFQPWKIGLAVFIGLGVSIWQFYKGLNGRHISTILDELANPNWIWLFMALIVLVVRDFGYIARIKHLTSSELNWKSSFYVIVLWEFASAITPSVVGGTAVAIFLLNREGIKMGKSIAYVTLTAILDNLFFILVAPLGMLLATDSAFFSETRVLAGFNFNLATIFYISYTLIATYTLFMAFGVLINPYVFQKIVLWVARVLRLSDNLQKKAKQLTIDNIVASRELKGLGVWYWIKAIGSTLFVWMARYFMLNCLLAAYFPMSVGEHEVAIGKQLVLWVTQLISPTPGASGFAESFMKELFGDSILIVAIIVLWRLLTYYTYLGLGSIFLPRWIKRTTLEKRKSN